MVGTHLFSSTFLVASSLTLVVQIAMASTCETGGVIHRPFASLRAVPDFEPSTVSGVTRIELSFNQIRSIEDNVFISFQHNDVCYIYLDNNRISNISEHAFNGVENITTLKLNNNMLATLPHALQNLGRLQELTLTENPLMSFDPSIMSVLGKNLNRFTVNMQHMSHWPNEIHFLRHLQTMTIDRLHQRHLTREMFHGLEGSLQTLQIHNSWLETVSCIICDLTVLRYLDISHSPFLNESNQGVFEPCKGNLSQITTLRLESNLRMTVFPVLGKTFASIEDLYFLSNDIDHLNVDDAFNKEAIESQTLYGNKFTSIPHDVNTFLNTIVLDLSINLITQVGDKDLDNLSNMKHLLLDHNPLVFVSNNAFSHNTKLRTINLSYTNLQTLPTSLKLLPDFTAFYVSDSMVECTCDLANLKGWNITSVHFAFGPVKCYQSSILLHDFIESGLANC